jgi:molecular chaperone GrpE
MVSFRKEKKKSRMAESQGAMEIQEGSLESSPAEGIRVTDRRRISLDADGAGARVGEAESQPNLKPSYVEELEARTRAAEKKIAEVQARFEQLRSQLQRETDETRQRLNRAADQRSLAEKADFIARLLPVGDNLQRAIEAAEQGGSLEAVVEGLRSTASSFENAIEASGVEPLASVGHPFDPELHEAVDTAPVSPERDGTVTTEYTRGFKMGDRLLRPARVQVGRAPGHAGKAAESTT